MHACSPPTCHGWPSSLKARGSRRAKRSKGGSCGVERVFGGADRRRDVLCKVDDIRSSDVGYLVLPFVPSLGVGLDEHGSNPACHLYPVRFFVVWLCPA